MIPPFRTFSEVANVNYALVDYSREQGGLAMVPGSHTLCRRPTPEESALGGENGNPAAVPMDRECSNDLPKPSRQPSDADCCCEQCTRATASSGTVTPGKNLPCVIRL